MTVYGHLYDITVSNRTTVIAGQPIARVGNTGLGGIHLHFEVHVDGVAQNPWLFFW
jgi:lysostaphin